MKLVIINGPCGVGKSKIAQMIHSQKPLSFLLDIDAQRRFISGYRENKEESGRMVNGITEAIILKCLSMECYVIIDKMIFDSHILDNYHEIAQKYKSEVVEIILWAPKNIVMKRTEARGWREGGLLTPEKCELIWDKINDLAATRPQATVIDTSNQAEKETYQQVSQLIR